MKLYQHDKCSVLSILNRYNDPSISIKNMLMREISMSGIENETYKFNVLLLEIYD